MLKSCRTAVGEDCSCKSASYVLQHPKMPVPPTKCLKTAVVTQGPKIWSRFKVGQVVGSLVVYDCFAYYILVSVFKHTYTCIYVCMHMHNCVRCSKNKDCRALPGTNIHYNNQAFKTRLELSFPWK